MAHHNSITDMAVVAFQPYGDGFEADIAAAVARQKQKRRRNVEQLDTDVATTGNGADAVPENMHIPLDGVIPSGAANGAELVDDDAEAAYQSNLQTGQTSNGKFDQKEVTNEWEPNDNGHVLYSVVSQCGRTEFLVGDDVDAGLLSEWNRMSHAEKDTKSRGSGVPDGHRLLGARGPNPRPEKSKGNMPSDIVLGEWSLRRLWARASKAKCYGQGCQHKFQPGGDTCLLAWLHR